jgi:hypothetical protein
MRGDEEGRDKEWETGQRAREGLRQGRGPGETGERRRDMREGEGKELRTDLEDGNFGQESNFDLYPNTNSDGKLIYPRLTDQKIEPEVQADRTSVLSYFDSRL